MLKSVKRLFPFNLEFYQDAKFDLLDILLSSREQDIATLAVIWHKILVLEDRSL